MRVRGAAILVLLLAGRLPVPAADEGEVRFTKPPTATRQGQTVTIAFAVNRQTDVAVYVENAKGDIVRHLVAGVLGKNPPEPLKANSLSQSLIWDGTDDDGKPADGGPFKVRVGLGLRTGYGGMAFAEQNGPNRLLGVLGLAAGADGRLYVLDVLHGAAHVGGTTVHVFRRDGAFEKTIKPFSPNVPVERLAPVGAFRDRDGRTLPLIHLPSEHLAFYPAVDVQGQQMAWTPEGHLLMAARPVGRNPFVSNAPHLAAIDRDGSIPHAAYTGPQLAEKQAWGVPHLATSSDRQSIFVTGLGTPYHHPSGTRVRNSQQVFRVPLPARGPAAAIFGEMDTPGEDDKHLNDPMGLAVDGRGHLQVADRGNNRVVVLHEKDGRFAGSFAVPSPGWLGVHPKTGAVYVHSRDQVLKFARWDDPRQLAALSLPGRPLHNQRWSFALDASTEPPVLWIGRKRAAGRDTALLLRCEDRGGTFSDPEPAPGGARPMQRFISLSADPLRREVGCLSSIGRLLILNEASGQVRSIQVSCLKGLRPSLGPQSGGFQLGRNGKVYLIAFSSPVSQHDSTTGQGIAFPSPAAAANNGGLPLTDGRGQPGRSAHGLGTDRRGNIYVKHLIDGEDGWRISVYRPDGTFIRTVVRRVPSRGILGPRVDLQGNIYIATALHPPGRAYPESLEPHIADANREWQSYLRGWYGDFLYGSVVKFGPEGGAIWPAVKKGEQWVAGGPPSEVAVSAGLKTETFEAWGRPMTVQGAQWCRFGYSPLQEKGPSHYDGCHCIYTSFDVDDFGRVFHPDQARFQAVVLDTNGNEILRFGGYGNQNCCGPDSYVLDPDGRFCRPRRAGDPEGLVSPFARPEIAFAWMTGMAVTDQYLYVGDQMNRRVLRVRLGYAATQTAAIPER